MDTIKSVFSPLTTDEADILHDHLWSGRSKQTHVHGYSEGGIASETHEVVVDLDKARRERWNTEHPDHKY
jgi:hypothetical protein